MELCGCDHQGEAHAQESFDDFHAGKGAQRRRRSSHDTRVDLDDTQTEAPVGERQVCDRDVGEDCNVDAMRHRFDDPPQTLRGQRGEAVTETGFENAKALQVSASGKDDERNRPLRPV
jgi:hypothetical protein